MSPKAVCAFIAVAVTSGGLAACGGGRAPTAGTGTPPTRPTVTVTTTPPNSPAAASSGPTTSAAGAACADGSIRVTVGRQGAGLGHNATVLLFRNESASMCTLRGYPGVTPYAHQERGTPAKRTPRGYMGGAPVRTVPIAAGGVASALVEGTDVPTGGKRSCPTYTSLAVTPPNLYRTSRLDVKIPACSRLLVHPVTKGKHGTRNQ